METSTKTMIDMGKAEAISAHVENLNGFIEDARRALEDALAGAYCPEMAAENAAQGIARALLGLRCIEGELQGIQVETVKSDLDVVVEYHRRRGDRRWSTAAIYAASALPALHARDWAKTLDELDARIAAVLPSNVAGAAKAPTAKTPAAKTSKATTKAKG